MTDSRPRPVALFRRGFMWPAVVAWRSSPARRHRPYPRVWLLHAHADGRAVLLGDASRRTVCGVMARFRRGELAIQWRRWFR